LYSFRGRLTPEVDFRAVVLVRAICYYKTWSVALTGLMGDLGISAFLLDDFLQRGISIGAGSMVEWWVEVL
jgi:hypothetical protein